MAILTPLTETEIAQAAAAFGVDVARAEGVLAGSVNTNYALLGADGRRWFLRLYEEQAPEGAAREARLLHRLALAGVPTPAPLPRSDGHGHTLLVRSKAAALFPFVEGRIRCQKSVTEGHARAVGEALARIHLVGERSFGDADDLVPSQSRFDLPALRARLERLDPSLLSDEVGRSRERLLTTNRELERAPLRAPAVPLVHGDVFRDNVLFGDAGLTAVLDFESASRGSAAFDLAVTWLAWCFGDHLEPGLSRALVGGYASVRALSAEERADLFPAARRACCRFATTRITDYELRPPGVGIYKDFRRWLRRDDEVAALGPLGLVGFLGLDG